MQGQLEPADEMVFAPSVSAVITTLRRPLLVQRAIASVLRQTVKELELIVVIDGPDEATAQALAHHRDTRLRVVVLEENVGASEARNEGARAARADWVAFLDDDDEWLPRKLELQLAAVLTGDPQTNFVACRYQEQNSQEIRIRPKHFPASDEDWGMCFYRHAGLLLPSTFLVRRSLLLDIPFTKGLRRTEDVDWCLRARAAGALHPEWVQEALTIYHSEDPTGNRLSQQAYWREQYDWLQQQPGLLSRRSLPYYIGMICIPEAKRSVSPILSCVFLLKAALRQGELNTHAVVYLAVATLSSINLRTQLRRKLPFLQRRTSLRAQV